MQAKLRGLFKKAQRTLQHEGPVALGRKTVVFTGRTIARSRFFPRRYRQVTPAYVHRWYGRHGRKVSIVIPSYNDLPLLKSCLASLEKTVRSGMAQIIIVDDYCKEEHRQKLAELEQPHVKVIYRKTNGGFAKAINTGMKAAKTGDVILLNSDTAPQKGWLEALQYGAYRVDPKVGITTAKLLYPNGTIQYAGTYRNQDQREWFDHIYRFQSAGHGPANVPAYVLAASGAAMYIRRAVITKIGLLDEKFGMGFEDVDYSLRAWEAGYRTLYFPLSAITHKESATRGKTQGKREMDSLHYFWKKWGKWFDQRNIVGPGGKPKIIYVLQDTSVGGGCRVVLEHLNNLAGLGWDAQLYSLSKSPDWFDLRVPCHSFRSYKELIAALEEEEAIKVATWWETAQPVWLASVKRGIPVYYVQDIESSYYQHDPVMQQAVLASYRPEFTYLTESTWNKEQLAALGRAATVILDGVDLETFRPLPDQSRNPNVLLAPGRRNPLKNLKLTLDAWRLMAPQPQLWLYGIEPDIADNESNMTYTIKPSDKEINQLLNQAAVFALTSQHEGYGLTILEAMAAGTPVVCTDAHGNRDFCVDQQNCLMVEQNNPKQVAEKLQQLFADQKLQARLRRAGLETVKRFRWDDLMKEVDAFYRKLAS